MKIILNYDEKEFPPILRLTIHGAYHYRQSKKDIEVYRKYLWRAWVFTGHIAQVNVPVDLEVLFVDPTSPDLPNLLLALSAALDQKTLKGPAILTDDGLISKLTAAKFYPCAPSKHENRVP